MRRTPQPGRGRFRATRRTAATLAVLLLVTGGAAACGQDGPGDTIDAFLAGWKSGDFGKVGFVAADGNAIPASKVLDEINALSGDLPRPSFLVSTTGEPKVTGEIAATPIKLDWTLPGGVPWSYPSTVRATERGSDGWRVIWEPTIVHSELTTGDRLELRRVPAPRGGIQDARGKPLVEPRPTVMVGVSPEKITNLTTLTAALNTAFRKINRPVDLSDLKTRVAEADKGAFIELVLLRRADYDRIRDDVRPLEGTVFREESRDLAPTREFAKALLGTVDPATRDDIVGNPDSIAQGDWVGHGGLQQRYDVQLRGTAGQSVVIARRAADGVVTDARIYSVDPKPGTPVKITLDPRVQIAADRAVAAEKQPSSLVAIRVSDSSVLAISNGPDGGSVNHALTGQVPPGSTFKMVSTLGLLQKKQVTKDTVVDCPKNRAVGGRQFKNSNDMALGRVPFHTDFAKSCNTAFVNLSPKLGADGLRNAATALGLGTKWDIGTESFSGKVSSGNNATELAAASFGQGTTVVSPIAMANATAAVARGQFQQPKLVLEPAPANPVPPGEKLDDTVVAPLREMMREVVTRGTGEALRSVPGGAVFGKTGTAEFQTGSAETHSWFVGWQGDIAFAVMVQKGGAGSDAAVPIVSRFLTNLKQ
jgi:cell division protein FtsI/penicillin-binding protein 2